MLWIDRLDSALGELTIVTNNTHLCALEYEGDSDRMMSFLQRRYETIEFSAKTNPLGVTQKLAAYLDGDYGAIEDIPVNPGGTAFQQKVWTELGRIPLGQTWTYGELATALGKPTASRAVGMANSKNPIAIVIPCHRVIGASKALTGYSGGLERKRWLLDHEGHSFHQGSSTKRMMRSPVAPISLDPQSASLSDTHNQLSLL